jgi:spermidine synthase
VEACKTHLPQISSGAFDDRRVSLLITDGLEYLKTNQSEKFDIIIVDSSDPSQGPNGTLFQEDFYNLVKSNLNPQDGVACFQAEHQWFHQNLIKVIHDRCRNIFSVVNYYFTQVPTYPGGQIGFFICGVSSSFDPRKSNESPGIPGLRYYNAEVHQAAFALPVFVLEYLNAKQ